MLEVTRARQGCSTATSFHSFPTPVYNSNTQHDGERNLPQTMWMMPVITTLRGSRTKHCWNEDDKLWTRVRVNGSSRGSRRRVVVDRFLQGDRSTSGYLPVFRFRNSCRLCIGSETSIESQSGSIGKTTAYFYMLRSCWICGYSS